MNVLAIDTENNTWNTVPCKEWAGYKDKDGYGMKQYEGRPQGVHRLEWMKYNGPIPTGMKICHHCDNPACYEIAHLFIGTHKDNMEDMVRKGRAARNGTPKLTAEQVLRIREDVRPQLEIAKEYGITKANVSAIKLRKSWRRI